ncbi:MAG: hydrogenase maturation peptidase HycI [Endomicrobiales bacterium]
MELLPLLQEKLAGATRVAILGVGSELRADDVAGILVAQECEKIHKAENFKVFYGYTAPENITGEIRKFSPSHLIIIDAADTSDTPGTISFINPDDIAGISFSTHMIPLKILVDYITADTKCQIAIIGIQPQTLTFGQAVTPAISATTTELATGLISTITKIMV